jgi:hypothetical protein
MLNMKYKLLGKEELDWVCEFCGKKEISFCFTVQDMETGDIKRFGSVCIKKALKITSKELKDEIKVLVSDIKKEYNNQIFELQEKASIIMEKYRKENNYNIGFLPQTEIEYWGIENKISDLRKEMYDKVRIYD